MGAIGLDTTQTGDAAFKQPFVQSRKNGTNILAVIPGSELPNEYVFVGAHYDHLGDAAAPSTSGDTVCNGATDNAAGVAAALAIGRGIAALPTRAAPLGRPRALGRRGGRPARLALLHQPSARAARQHGRLHQLRHPGRQPAAEPPQLHLRGRRGDRLGPGRHGQQRRAASSTLDVAPAELHLRPGPQRLRQLRQRGGADDLLQRFDRPLLPHQRRRARGRRLRQARAADAHAPTS